MKLIFMGTPEFAVPSLARLISDEHEIAAVFTQPDKPAGRGKRLQPPPVKTLALLLAIPVHQPAKIKTSEEVRAIFEHISPDACIVAAYGKILPEWMLEIPRLGCINVHASLLPKYRGAAPINWAIANGERESGITIMQMDAGLDTGPIISNRAVEILPDETASDLSTRLASLGADLLSETLPLIEQGRIQPVSQDDRQATYAPMLKREDGEMDWQMDARQIANRVRAFQPWPGAYTRFRGSRLLIWRAAAIQMEDDEHIDGKHRGFTDSAQPSVIVAMDKSGITIACAGPSLLRIEELQIEGKRRMSARDFANGMRLSIGDRLADAEATSKPSHF